MILVVWLAVFRRCSGACTTSGCKLSALRKLYGAEQLRQVIASHWHYSVAQWLGVKFGPDAGWLSMMGLGAVFFLPFISPCLSSAVLGSAVRHRAQTRNQRKAFCYLHSVRADCTADAAVMAGGAGASDFGVVIGKDLPAAPGVTSSAQRWPGVHSVLRYRRKFPAIWCGRRRTVSPAQRAFSVGEPRR